MSLERAVASRHARGDLRAHPDASLSPWSDQRTGPPWPSRSRRGPTGELCHGLELELRRVGRNVGRVVARQAGAAELRRRPARRLARAPRARGTRATSRRCAPAPPRRSVRRDELLRDRRSRCRRSSGRSPAARRRARAPRSRRVEEHLHDLPRRVSAHDRVVDDHDPLAGDLGERVELQLDPLLAQPLLGLDERARRRSGS